MKHQEIDWGRSITQQIEEILVATMTARNLVRQIGYKNDAHPELITKESYTYFQSVINSVTHLAWEVESNPLYKEALTGLRETQSRKRQRVVAKFFGNLLS